jgi:mRNA interferase YafQ
MRFKTTRQFEKDYRKIRKSDKNLDKLHTVMQRLIGSERLSYQYKDHALSGQFKNRRECHIEPDWLLVYQVNKREEIIIFERTGSHADIFG